MPKCRGFCGEERRECEFWLRADGSRRRICRYCCMEATKRDRARKADLQIAGRIRAAMKLKRKYFGAPIPMEILADVLG